jgi:chaperonin GroES
MSVTPVNDRILIIPLTPETKTSSGLVIPSTAQEKLPHGTVFSVGQGRRLPDGTFVPPDVAVGETVIYSQSAAQSVKLDGKNYVVVKEEDILCVLYD